MDKEARKIIMYKVREVKGPEFLKIKHLELQLEFPNGEFGNPFVHDVVERKSQDAVIICAVQNKKVWLRSCIRPAIGDRFPFPNTQANTWELPAGLIDEGEQPVEAAIRELKEEVGFNFSNIVKFGDPVWGSVGLVGELLHFFATDVSDLERQEPTCDGSETERNGECILVGFSEAMKLNIDMKTELGLHRLRQNHLI
jgi:8-oxo-dGTP pyrophosphatase MutT (NUDIX family)